MQIVVYLAISKPKNLKMKKMQTANGGMAVYMGKGGQCHPLAALRQMKELTLYTE
jgi:hypothetical protein